MSSDNDVKIDDIQPLRMFISGVGGTGKSFLFETIKCFVDSLWKAKPGELSCAIVAPTGLAAFNVGGLTIDRLFQLPIEHEGKTAGYLSLPKDTQKKLQTTFRPLKVLSAEFYFYKPITLHLELYLFYCFIHFVLYIGQY